MSTSFLGSFSPTSTARSAAIVFGALGILMGTRAALSPVAYSQDFGFSPASPTTQTARSNPFIFVAGWRSIAAGLALLGCTYIGADRAAGMVMLAGGLVPLMDGLAVARYSEPLDEEKATAEERERVALATQAVWTHSSFFFVVSGRGRGW